MSRLTEILLFVGPRDERRAEDLSFCTVDQAARADDRTDASAGHLLPLTGELGSEAWGGHKWPATTIWAGVANSWTQMPPSIASEGSCPMNPSCVQLLLRDDGDPWFGLSMICDRGMCQYARPPRADERDRSW